MEYKKILYYPKRCMNGRKEEHELNRKIKNE